MSFAEALALFRRLGVNVEIMTRDDFRVSYFALARRYHPDRNPRNAQLMANINAARAVILEASPAEVEGSPGGSLPPPRKIMTR